MLDAHARRGFPDWLTVAATCRAVFSEAQLPKLRHARLSHDRRHLRLPADLRTQIGRVDTPYGELLRSAPGGGGSGAGQSLSL